MSLLSNLFKKKVTVKTIDCAQYIDLVMPCVIDEQAVTTKNGARMSLIRLRGNISVMGQNEYDNTCNELLRIFKSLYQTKNVAMSWMHEQDSTHTKTSLTEMLRPNTNAAAKHGLDMNLLNDDIVKGNTAVCQHEETMIAIWTYPVVEQEYVNGDLKNVRTENMDLMDLHERVFKGSANPFLSDSNNINKHKQNVQFVLQGLRRSNNVSEVLTGKKASKWILNKINPTMPTYTPLEYVDEARIGTPSASSWLINPETGEIDLSAFRAPPLSEQMARTSLFEDEHHDGILESAGRWYGTHTIDLMPKQIVHFNRLRQVLKNVPFRMNFILKPKSTELMATLNESLNRYLGGVSEANREHYKQLKVQGAMKEEFDYPSVNMQILIVTWGDTKQEVLRNSDQINQGLVDWGGARMDYDNISPAQTFFSSIAGVNLSSHSTGCLIGAERLVQILPHQIENSLFEYGSIIFRHESGKPCMFQPNNPMQDYDLTIYIARPRQGKSLTMNAKNIANLAAEGAETLPLLVSMDIGPSSEGALQSIRLMMEEKLGRDVARRLVVSHKWDPQQGGWKVNPMDVRLGRLTPTKQEAMFILNFYRSICSDAETGYPPAGGDDLLEMCISNLYLNFSKLQYVKRINPAVCPDLIKLMAEHSVQRYENAHNGKENGQAKSYFDIRDELFLKGSVEGASQAHRYAMPVCDDLIDMLATDPSVIKRFETIYPDLCEKMAHKLRTHRAAMPHLCSATTLDLSDASIISFDLKPITDNSTDNSARIRLFSEYLLAMNLGMSKFFINDGILDGMPPIFYDFWRQRIRQYGQVDKCLNLDEWHALTIKKTTESGETISMPVAGAAYIEMLIKEAPKWRLNINMASHSSADFTETMKQKATNVFLYSGTTGTELDALKNDFSLTDTELKALEGLHGPDAERGSQMLWLYTANIPNMNSVRGSAKVEFLCCGAMLWGLNTSAKDLPHKLRLEKEFGDKPWLKALVNAFPSGSMQSVRGAFIENLRESNIIAEDQTSGIEEKLFARTVKTMKVMQYGEDVIAESEALISEIGRKNAH